MSDKLLRCVCGSTSFFRNYRAGGWWTQLVESKEGGGVTVEQSFTDSIRLGHEPKTMRCADCKRKVKNPDA